MLKKRLSVGLLVLVMVVVNITSFAAPKGYPERPIELVIPAGAGGGLDTTGRFFAEELKKEFKVPIKVSNISGGAHVKGILYAYSAPADGYTIHALSPSDIMADVFKKMNFRFIDEFVAIARVNHDTAVISVSAKSKYKTIQDLIGYAKANPGRLAWGGLSPGGIDDAVSSAFAKQAGFTFTFIPHESAGELNAAILGGHVDVSQGEPVEVAELVRSGDMRPLMVIGEKRVDSVPEFKNVPCSKEIGLNIDLGTWRGFAVRKGTPDEIVKLLESKFKKIYNSKAWKDYARKNGLDTRPGWLDSKDFTQSWHDEVKLYTEIFTELGRIK